jgi:hypothetical protein
MPKDTGLAVTFVEAIGHGHVPVSGEKGASEWVVTTKDPKEREGERETLLSLVDGIDSSVQEIEVTSFIQ